MVCEQCKECWNYLVCEVGCFGGNEPCEHLEVGEPNIVCEECKSKELEDKLIDTNYRYSDYFEEDIKEDTVKFKCKKCGYEWIEVI